MKALLSSRVFEQIKYAVLEPLRALRVAHLPILSIYAASGALGLIAVADGFWVKGALQLTTVDLATIAIWLQLPWIAKMVVSELVDATSLKGASRRVYILAGALLIAVGLVILAGAAGGWLTVASKERLYVVAQLIIVIGGVIQEVVADALVPGVVARFTPDGRPRAEADINAELAMIELLARLVYTAAAFAVGALAGRLAAALPAQSVYLIGLIIPFLSMAGALIAPVERGTSRAIDWRILGGGIGMAAVALALGLSDVAHGQDAIFAGAFVALCLMLRHVMADVAPVVRQQIILVGALAFVFRATPSIGDGFRWYGIDKLGFDEAFFGTLQLTGTGVGLVLMWLLARVVIERPVRQVIGLLTVIAGVLYLPTLILAHGGEQWTLRNLGFGARGIALIDEGAQSPLALLATVPLLALVAVHAPREHRATWFALIASMMSLAIVAGQLISKYLNGFFPIERGSYDNVPGLVSVVVGLSVAMPLAALIVLRPRTLASTQPESNSL